MPVLHCSDCHHEYEGQEGKKCAWCGGEGYVLAPWTGLEQMLRDLRSGKLKFKDLGPVGDSRKLRKK